MGKKEIAITVLVIALLLLIGLRVNDKVQENKEFKLTEAYNEGMNDAVIAVMQYVVDQGYVDITVPYINETNHTNMMSVRLIPYQETQNAED